MGVHELEVVRTLPAGVNRVWRAVSDVHQVVQWFPSCLDAWLVDADAPDVGVRRVLLLDAKGRQVRSEQEITHYEPERRFAWRHVADTVDGKPFGLIHEPRLHFTLTPVEEGARIDVAARYELRGFRVRLASPVIRRVVGEQMRQALENLARHVDPTKVST